MTASLSSEIIVGIDFGTTHSGVSWVLNEGQKRIRLINDWPNPLATIATADKVPSTISYKNGRIENWGYNVGLQEEPFRWFKILLEPGSKYSSTTQQVRQSNDLLGRINKTVDEVVSDYLREIWKYTKDDISKRVLDDKWENNFTVHVVLTVPAMWSHVAKDKTLKAATAAGLPSNIRLVTEPEAAALAILRDKADDNVLREGDAFVVCDAGGGTVDLISYKVNGLQPLKMEECAIGDGGLCGSVFLDIAFVKYIKTLVGEDQYNRLKERDKKKMLLNFEYGVKRAFIAQSTKDYSVDLRGVKDNEAENIIDETIGLKQTMLRTIFDHVCGQIDALVHNQISEVEKSNLRVKAILLVGGFGSSKYLHHRLEKSFSSRNIAVHQVDGAWSAICRGACLWGLEHTNQSRHTSLASKTGVSTVPPTVIRRISKYSYGVAVSEPFDPSRHLWSDRYLDEATNTYRATDQMRWLIRRGEKVTEGRKLSLKIREDVHGVGFTSVGTRDFTQSLYYCQDDNPPSRKEDSVQPLCHVTYSVQETLIWQERSFRSAARPGKWRSMVFDLMVELGNATLDYLVMYKNDLVGRVEAEYVEPLS